jgi:serine protease Do
MFQIDAAVNNGNSGGPVFDVYGQVIGVVTAKYSLGGLEGLGFAIPIGDACDIARDLVEKGYVTGKAYLGLTMATVSPSVAKYYDMVQGVYVYDVEEGSCAEEAGLTAGDIITAIDGESVLRSSDLAKAVKLYRAGDSAVLTVYREPEYIEVTVVFDEELPAGAAAPTPEAAGGATGDMAVRES